MFQVFQLYVSLLLPVAVCRIALAMAGKSFFLGGDKIDHEIRLGRYCNFHPR